MAHKPHKKTKTVLRAARRRKLPLICFVNKMDKQNASVVRSMRSMDAFDLNPLPLKAIDRQGF